MRGHLANGRGDLIDVIRGVVFVPVDRDDLIERCFRVGAEAAREMLCGNAVKG